MVAILDFQKRAENIPAEAPSSRRRVQPSARARNWFISLLPSWLVAKLFQTRQTITSLGAWIQSFSERMTDSREDYDWRQHKLAQSMPPVSRCLIKT